MKVNIIKANEEYFSQQEISDNLYLDKIDYEIPPERKMRLVFFDDDGYFMLTAEACCPKDYIGYEGHVAIMLLDTFASLFGCTAVKYKGKWV